MFENLWFIAKYSLKFSKVQYLIAVLDIVFDSVVPFVDLLFPKWIIDELTNEKRWETVLFYIVVWTGLNGIILLFRSMKWILLNPYNSRCDFKESMMWGNLCARMDYERLENSQEMDEQNRIKNNLYMSSFAYHPLASFLSTLIRLAGYTYIVATLHPLMIFFLVVIVSLTLLLSQKKEKARYGFQQKISGFNRRFQYLFNVMTGFSYAKEVRINNASKWIVSRYSKEQGDYTTVFRKNQIKMYGLDSLSDLLLFVQTIALYFYSTYRVVIGEITIGSFSLYIGAVTSFCSTFINMLDQLTSIRFLSEYAASFKAFLDSSKPFYELNGINSPDIQSGKFVLEFQNVSFKYPGTDNYAIQNVSVTINSGERLSVVGMNGSGKSTFIKLICRLYEPTEGVILLNGVDISTINYDEYIALLALVFQDFNIYAMSIRENIILSKVIEDYVIKEAIDNGGLTDKIVNLPKGLETQIGKDFDPEGVVFSGGEQQKLVCTRAYIRKTPIIILDEPTASLDAIAESSLYQRFDRIIGNKTAIYVSHRLASTYFCDRIIVFNNGKVVETGTHSELLAANGLYAEMFMKQAEGYC